MGRERVYALTWFILFHKHSKNTTALPFFVKFKGWKVRTCFLFVIYIYACMCVYRLSSTMLTPFWPCIFTSHSSQSAEAALAGTKKQVNN